MPVRIQLLKRMCDDILLERHVIDVRPDVILDAAFRLLAKERILLGVP